MTSRGELRFHPMTIDGRLKSFASFNNVNCPQGFLYFNKEVGLERGYVHLVKVVTRMYQLSVWVVLDF